MSFKALLPFVPQLAIGLDVFFTLLTLVVDNDTVTFIEFFSSDDSTVLRNILISACAVALGLAAICFGFVFLVARRQSASASPSKKKTFTSIVNMCTQSVASLYNTIVLFALGGVAPAVSLALTTPHAILSMSTLPSVTGPFWLDSIVILFPLTAFILSTLLHRADALFSSSPDRTSTSSSATSVFPFWFWIVHIILTSLPLLLRRSYMHNIKMVDDSEKQDVLEDSSIGISVGPLMPPPAILVHHHFDDDENNVDGLRKADAITPVSTFDSNDDDQTDMSEGENDGNTANTATHSSNNGKGTLLQQRKGWKVAASTNSHTFKIRYKRGAQIGSGAYGTVAIALNELTGELMAVKTIEVCADDTQLQRRLSVLQTEIDMLRTLEHPNIVQYYFAERTKLPSGNLGMNIFMEYVPGGSILGVLRQFGALSEVVVASYTEQILLALLYLHESNVVHRDIKSANILLTTEGSCKVADFGAAVALESLGGKSKPLGFAGTPLWMAPEVLREQSDMIDWHADIWSLGCTVMEMLTGKHPFHHIASHDRIGILTHIIESETDEACLRINDLGVKLSEDCVDFLQKCLRRDPSERPTCMMLLAHPFIQEGGGPPPLEPVFTPMFAPRRSFASGGLPPQQRSFSRASSRGAGAPTTNGTKHTDEDDDHDITTSTRRFSMMDVQREAQRRTAAMRQDNQLRQSVLVSTSENVAKVNIAPTTPSLQQRTRSSNSSIVTTSSSSKSFASSKTTSSGKNKMDVEDMVDEDEVMKIVMRDRGVEDE
eukprot:PhM_4_TR15662/c6_g1_i1/m.3406/K20717/YDA; mitogen-activated protein kinase kinase kinase YODA